MTRSGKKYPDYSKLENVVGPMKAIRLHCLDCHCDNAAETARCIIKGCSLWPYRFGKNPKRKGVGGSFQGASSADTSTKA